MIEYLIIMLLLSAIFLLLLAALNAVILRWRARKLNAWAIRFKNAFFISLKSTLGLWLISSGSVFLVIALFRWIAHIASESRLAPVAVTLAVKFDPAFMSFREYGFMVTYGLGVVVAWFIQAHYLQKLGNTDPGISKKEARKISLSTLIYFVGLTFVLPVVVAHGKQLAGMIHP